MNLKKISNFQITLALKDISQTQFHKGTEHFTVGSLFQEF